MKKDLLSEREKREMCFSEPVVLLDPSRYMQLESGNIDLAIDIKVNGAGARIGTTSSREIRGIMV